MRVLISESQDYVIANCSINLSNADFDNFFRISDAMRFCALYDILCPTHNEQTEIVRQTMSDIHEGLADFFEVLTKHSNSEKWKSICIIISFRIKHDSKTIPILISQKFSNICELCIHETSRMVVETVADKIR
jgi:hypothetical protein